MRRSIFINENIKQGVRESIKDENIKQGVWESIKVENIKQGVRERIKVENFWSTELDRPKCLVLSLTQMKSILAYMV